MQPTNILIQTMLGMGHCQSLIAMFKIEAQRTTSSSYFQESVLNKQVHVNQFNANYSKDIINS